MWRTTRVAGIGALMAAALVTGVLTGAGAQAHPGAPDGRFDPDSVSWVSVRDATPVLFDNSVTANRDAGRIAIDMDADADGAGYRLAAVFQRNLDGRDWQLLHGLTDPVYTQAWNNAAANGMRLVDYETYVLAGVRYHNGLWIENVEGYAWTSQRNMTANQWLDYRDSQQDAGRIVIDFDQYETGAGPRYAAVSVSNADGHTWAVPTGLTTNGLTNSVNLYNGAGWRPLVAESVLTGGVQRYAAIFLTNPSGRDWATAHDLTAAQYALLWSAYADAGFRLVGFERYDTAAGVRYLGIWRQND